MNILLLGSGGREHALAYKMSQSHHCDKLFIAPGNGGTGEYGTNTFLDLADFKGIETFCLQNQIHILVVGPEDPLVNGIYDYLKANPLLEKLIIIGPSKAAAQLEGSKSFSKKFMQRHGIPTAAYAEFTESNFNEGINYLQTHSLPIVLKADGLAAGKGVIICQTHDEALQVFESMLIGKQFGLASSKVVVEEFLTGIEVSVFVLTNGNDYQIIGHAKDYKRVGEGDTGLNTGGMGCVTPVPFVDENFMQIVETTIIQPTINGIAKEGLIYNGFIFFGLMNCNGVPKVIEYNCRMGDPETEVVMPRLDTDLVSLFAAMDNGTLIDANINFNEGYFATIIAVSGGYPGQYQTKLPITGLNSPITNGSKIFHAGTLQLGNQLVTNGGRVLAATSSGNTMQEAVDYSLDALKNLHFDGIYYRKDIGYEFKN